MQEIPDYIRQRKSKTGEIDFGYYYKHSRSGRILEGDDTPDDFIADDMVSGVIRRRDPISGGA